MVQKTSVLRGSPRNLSRLAAALRRGELVAVPTETVYGLAANALDARACREIFRAKRRPANDPLIVHVHALREIDAIAELNPAARKLAARFWPGPLTLVLPKRPSIPDVVSAGLPSVAIRMPAHPLFRRLLKRVGRPLAAPSANPFGYVSPTSAAHVLEGLGGRIPAILDGGPASIGVESTIVDLRDPRRPRLLRPGAISRREIEKALGRRVSAAPRRSAPADGAQVAPGLLARHYSPRTRVVLHPKITRRNMANASPGEAWLFFSKPKFVSAGSPGPAREPNRKHSPVAPADGFAQSSPGSRRTEANVRWLDEAGDPKRAARRLFAALRELDSGRYATIHVELAPAGGIGDAINDRLQRAAAR